MIYSRHLHVFFMILCLLMTLPVSAKVSYLPNYYTHVTLEEDSGRVQKDSTILGSLFMSTEDQHFDIVVWHDSITNERIKAIKQARTARALSIAAAVTGSVASVMSISQVALSPLSSSTYLYGTNAVLWGGITASSIYTSYVMKDKIEELERLPINITITNNTDREMCVNDLSRGLFWYVRANSAINMSVGNPEINQFRIAYADIVDTHPNYVVVQAYNDIERIPEMIFEDDSCWIFRRLIEVPNKDDAIWYYYMRDKTTLKEKIINEKMADDYKRTHKEPFVY